jgi:hypothetical protein
VKAETLLGEFSAENSEKTRSSLPRDLIGGVHVITSTSAGVMHLGN